MDFKKILYCILLSTILSSCILFTYDGGEPDYYSTWNIENSTDRILIFYPNYDKSASYNRKITLNPHSTTEIESVGDNKKFEIFLTYIGDSVVFMNANNDLILKVWGNDRSSGKEFFNESSWTKNKEQEMQNHALSGLLK